MDRRVPPESPAEPLAGSVAVKDAALALLRLARDLRAASGLDGEAQTRALLAGSAAIENEISALIVRFGVASTTYEALTKDAQT